MLRFAQHADRCLPLPFDRFARAATLLLGMASISVAAFGQPHPPSTRAVSPEQRLLAQVETLSASLQGGVETAGDPVAPRQALLARLREYLTMYPGGAHRTHAVRLELQTLFEIGSLSGGKFDALCEQVDEILGRRTLATDRCEAAYWRLICERLARPAATTQPSRSVDAPDAEWLRACRVYLEECPQSRYAPRLASLLFDDARRRGDIPAMQQIVARLDKYHARHATSEFLRARLRRSDAIGRPVRMRFETLDGKPIDTREQRGRAVLIVVWSAESPACRALLRDIEAFRGDRQGIEVIGFNTDADPDDLRRTVQALNIDWPQAHDPMGLAGQFLRDWAVRQVPAVFVIGRRGRLRAVTDAAGWAAAAAAALAEN